MQLLCMRPHLCHCLSALKGHLALLQSPVGHISCQVLQQVNNKVVTACAGSKQDRQADSVGAP